MTLPIKGVYAARSPSYISYLVIPNDPQDGLVDCYLLTSDASADDGAPISASFHLLNRKTDTEWGWDSRDTLTIADGQLRLAGVTYKRLPAGSVAGVWRAKQSSPYFIVVPDEPTNKGFVWYELNGHYLTDRPGAVTLAFKHSAEKANVGWLFAWSATNKRVGSIGDRVMNIGSRDQEGQLVQLQKIV